MRLRSLMRWLRFAVRVWRQEGRMVEIDIPYAPIHRRKLGEVPTGKDET